MITSSPSTAKPRRARPPQSSGGALDVTPTGARYLDVESELLIRPNLWETGLK
jgi:hypothetical protein